MIGVMIHRRQVACDVSGSEHSRRERGARARRHCVGRLQAALLSVIMMQS